MCRSHQTIKSSFRESRPINRAGDNFTRTKDATEAEGEKDAKTGAALAIDFKDDMTFLNENKTTISVSYRGGGQNLKHRKFWPGHRN